MSPKAPSDADLSARVSAIYHHELLQYQRQLFENDSPLLVFDKCRQAGVTWTTALKAVCDAAIGRRSTYYCSYNLDMANATFMRDVRYWRSRLGFPDSSDAAISISRFPSGEEVRAMTSNPDNVRSKRGRLVIDEAAFVRDLKRTVDAAKALLNWGGQIITISTQDWDDHYYNTIVGHAESGEQGWKLCRLNLDQALDQGLYRKICEVKKETWTPSREAAWKAEILETAGDRAPQEYYCTPRKRTVATGNFFNPDRIIAHPSQLASPDATLRRFWSLPTPSQLASPDACKIATAIASQSHDCRMIEQFESFAYKPAKFERLIAKYATTDPTHTAQFWQRHPETPAAISRRLSAENIACSPSRRRVPIGVMADQLATALHRSEIVIAEDVRDRVIGAIVGYPDPSTHAAITALFFASDRLSATRAVIAAPRKETRRSGKLERAISMI